MSSANELCHGHKRLLLLIEFALSEGWEVHRTPEGLLKFVKPSLPPIFTSSITSDIRARQTLRGASAGRHQQGGRND